MPGIELRFYRDDAGRAPVMEWLRELRSADAAAFAKCDARLRLLAQYGYELRRPVADYLRDGVLELRVRRGRRNYRVLYFYHGGSAVLVHALTKEAANPRADMIRVLERKAAYERDPRAHTYEDTDD